MAKYNNKLGEMAPDNLVADIHVKQVTGSGTIVAGAGALKRGTVMALADGKLSVMKSGATPYGILTDDVDATEATVAEVYLTGKFNANALIVAAGYTLTAADIKVLRDGGIFIENAVN